MANGERRAEILDTAGVLFASYGLRTSLKDVADACGILPGSLYHHFESREAILIELVRRYRDDLDRVAREALAILDRASERSPTEELVIQFGRAIATCAVQNRAALLLTMYQPPKSAGREFARLARQAPTTVNQVMTQILENGRYAGEVRHDLDLALLADRLCLSMLHFGVGDSSRGAGASADPELRARILLRGLVTTPPSYAVLNRSDALTCAHQLVAEWAPSPEDIRVREIRLAAKSEFGRRGYEATGMRDVAAAAGVTSPVVYRRFGSKEALLESVMRPYADERRAAWAAVMASNSSPLEKLDALAWININLLDRFGDEFRIQLAWLRDSPPNLRKLGSTAAQRRGIKEILASGERSGEIGFRYGSSELRARCLYEALWTPEHIVQGAGREASHALARATVLSGALAVSSRGK